MSTTSGNYGGSGWTCAGCGQWVPYDVVHSCIATRPITGTSDATQLGQILMALGRIEQLLIDLKIRTKP